MWRALQIVFCFSWVIFLQNYSLLSGSRRNPVWSHKQMGKCLTTSRLTQCQEKAQTQCFGDKAHEAMLQVASTERTVSGGCFRRLLWMLQKKIKYWLYTLFSGFSEGGGEREGWLIYLLNAEIAPSSSHRRL